MSQPTTIADTLKLSKKMHQASFLNNNNTPLRMISSIAQDIQNVTGTFISPIKKERSGFKSAQVSEGTNSLAPSALDGSPNVKKAKK